MVDTATATAPATRASTGDLTPGVTYLDQNTYLGAKSDPAQLKKFINDWINLGGRGIIGGDGKPASYWDVYQDLAASGIDVSDLPRPETLPQGQAKGGGTASPMTKPAPTTPATPAGATQTSPELTDLLKTLGVDYQNAPAPTPALLAFLRGLGMTQSTAEDTRNTNLRLIGNREATGTEDINRESARSQTNVTADLIRRGVLQSGEATGRFARGEEDKAAKLSSLANTTAEGKAAADTAYSTQRDLLRQQALEKVMQTEMEQRQAEGASQAQKDALEAQKQAAELAYQRQQQADADYRKWYAEQIKAGNPAVSGA